MSQFDNNGQPPNFGHPGVAPQQPQGGQAGFQPQGGPAMPGAYGTAPMGQAPAPQVQPAPEGLPEMYLPDEQVVEQARKKAQAEAERIAALRAGKIPGGGDLKFFKFKGPGGITDSRQWPVGTEVKAHFWILPAYKAGMMPGVPRETVFWKSQRSPKGDSIGASDIIEAARKILFKSGVESDHLHAKNNGKPKTTYLYNILYLDDPQAHVSDDGKLVPMVLEANRTIHTAVEKLIREYGPARVCHPEQGRPIIVTKYKKGQAATEVEYGVTAWPDAMPLDPVWYPALHNLVELHRLDKEPTAERLFTAITEMKLPVTNEIMGMLQAKQAQEQQAAAAAQAQAAGTQSYVGGQNPGVQTPPAQASFQAGHQPPQPSPYQPQATAPVRLVAGQITQALPEGRERCFGQHNPQYQFCQQCPDWIKQQCAPQSAQQAQQAPQGDQLVALQNQMRGG